MRKAIKLNKENTHIFETAKTIAVFNDETVRTGRYVFVNGQKLKVKKILRNEKPLKSYTNFGRRYYEFTYSTTNRQK